MEREIRKKEDAERRHFKKVKDVSKTGMSKEDLWKEVQNQVKAQFRDLKSQTVVEQAN